MKKKKQRKCRPVTDAVQPNPIVTDPQGCYTGRPLENNETPVQDVDDL